jgi:hypothetical protein
MGLRQLSVLDFSDPPGSRSMEEGGSPVAALELGVRLTSLAFLGSGLPPQCTGQQTGLAPSRTAKFLDLLSNSDFVSSERPAPAQVSLTSRATSSTTTTNLIQGRKYYWTS